MSGPPGAGDGAAPRLGSMFGRYRIDQVVGRGGMGVVVRATDMELQRTVALKFVAPELADDPAVRERFIREARLAAAIEHPNIVPIHEAGEADGTLFLAMRAIPGPDLATVLRREAPLDPARTLAIVTPLADALDAAHRRGLVHRDVKPANVLLEPGEDGRPERPWLTDFGLTRRLSDSSPMTVAGPLGTIDYVAPELIDGGEIGPWTDQYSLACLIVHCLTGAPPWQGASDAAVLYAHVHGDRAALSGRVPGSDVAAVLARGLARDGHDRFPDCRAMVAALATAMGPGSTEASAAAAALAPAPAPAPMEATVRVAAPPGAGGPPSSRHRGRFAVVLSAVLGAAVLLGALGPRPALAPSPTADIRATASGSPMAPAASASPAVPAASGSPAVPMASGSPAPASASPAAPETSASPAVPTASATPPVPKKSDGVIVFSGGTGDELDIWAMNPDGSDRRRLTNSPGTERWPVVVPGGKAVIYSAGVIGNRDLWWLPLDGGRARKLTKNPGDDYAAAISRDGKKLLWVSDRDGDLDIWMMKDRGGGFDEADSLNLTDLPGLATEPTDIFPAWAPDGRGFVYASNRGVGPLWWKDLDPPGPARLLTNDDPRYADMSPTVGPGGTVFFIGRRDREDREIYRTKADGTPIQLTDLVAEVGTPALSPTGDRLIAAVGRFDDAVTPLKTQLMIFGLRGATQDHTLRLKGLDIATDPDWVRVLASPAPSPGA